MKQSILKRISGVFLLFFFFGMAILFQACNNKENKENTKSIEQIRAEDGVPVKVQELQFQNFEKNLSFYSTLSGIQESKVFPIIVDEVKKVNVSVGSVVSQGKIVIEFPHTNPSLQYEQAKQALDNAEKLYKRMKELLKAGETSQQNLDNAETQYLVSKRNWESIKQIVNVESPISGKIIELFVKPGDHVDPGKPLFTVAQTGQMKAKIWVSTQEVVQIKNGMTASIIIADKEYQGRVAEVALAMDDKRRAFGVEIHFSNSAGTLKSGMTADVIIRTYQKQNSIIVPRHVVQTEQGKLFVYVENNNKAEKRYIEKGEESGISYEIISGLNPGDKIITEGLSLVADGKKVKIMQ